MDLHRCTRLHLTITSKGCEDIRNRARWGGQAKSPGGRPSRPPQCNGCEDWMQWDDSNAIKLKPKKEERKAMPTKTKQRCEGCGEVKTLLSKTHCHQCVKDRIKAEAAMDAEEIKTQSVMEEPQPAPPVQAEESADAVRIDFTDDADLLEELKAQAHRNYRTLSGEIFATLRAATGVDRPKDAA